jgi:hypothetical protein
MSPAEGASKSIEPQQRVRDRLGEADIAMSDGEHDGSSRTQLDDLATEVISARVALSDSQVANGLIQTSDEHNQHERDRQLLKEGQGSAGFPDPIAGIAAQPTASAES